MSWLTYCSFYSYLKMTSDTQTDLVVVERKTSQGHEYISKASNRLLLEKGDITVMVSFKQAARTKEKASFIHARVGGWAGV